MKSKQVQLSGILVFILGVLAASVLAIGNGSSLAAASYFNTPSKAIQIHQAKPYNSRLIQSRGCARFMLLINPPKIEELSRSTTLMRGIGLSKPFLLSRTSETSEV